MRSENTVSAMPDKDDKTRLPAAAKNADVDAFLRRVAAMPAARPASGRGRLIFAMDATASREPSWDRACKLQGEMFEATAALGGLDVQLVFYRGFKECKASKWLSTAAALHGAMRAVCCMGGETQIARVLRHALNEAEAQKIGALVFVGDAMEEKLDELCGLAGQLGLRGVPGFLFHEGNDAAAARAFKDIARLSHGAYCRFDSNSADELRALLGAVAAYAAGGHRALADYGNAAGGSALLLARQLGTGS
ncbi:MAG TPA: VWA domain-containing protein [Stellaceae bacterium]|nr:VWA domain-containing protein [Stellaceae bacterium]